MYENAILRRAPCACAISSLADHTTYRHDWDVPSQLSLNAVIPFCVRTPIDSDNRACFEFADRERVNAHDREI